MPKSPRQASLPGMEPAGDALQSGVPLRSDAEPPSNNAPNPRTANPAACGLAPPSISDWTVYVVDSHSLIFQVFHAMGELTSPRGEPVNAVYGFARDLIQIIERKRPTA